MSAQDPTPPEPPRSPGRMVIVTLVGVVAVVAVVAVVIVLAGPARLNGSRPSASGPVTGSDPLSSDLLMTDALLQRQSLAVATGDRAGYLDGWAEAPLAQRRGILTFTNFGRLGIARIEPRVDEGTVSGAGSTWTAAVDVTWGLSGLDPTKATSTLLYTFAERGARAVVVKLAPMVNGREPVWLLPQLVVRRGPGTLVAGTDPGEVARIERLLQGARVAVGRVLPRWRGDLVAYAPSSQSQFGALIDARPGQYSDIAAVTTTVDGSHDTSAPTAIVVNPQVFGGLGTIGAQVVVTHEATHAATDAAAVSMPLWVAEGFADYVGIGSVDIPVPVAAHAALSIARRVGPPAALPGDAAFAVGGSRLEATYEQAWLATSLIARTYGQADLVAFYRAVEARPSDLAGAFVTVLHTTVPEFTRAWRAYLEGLASGS